MPSLVSPNYPWLNCETWCRLTFDTDMSFVHQHIQLARWFGDAISMVHCSVVFDWFYRRCTTDCRKCDWLCTCSELFSTIANLICVPYILTLICLMESENLAFGGEISFCVIGLPHDFVVHLPGKRARSKAGKMASPWQSTLLFPQICWNNGRRNSGCWKSDS